MNEEYLVSAIHQIALITSLSFVHTARRFYRLDYSMRTRDVGVPVCRKVGGALAEPVRISLSRGRRSRNKVSVGEPSDGSLALIHTSLLPLAANHGGDNTFGKLFLNHWHVIIIGRHFIWGVG